MEDRKVFNFQKSLRASQTNEAMPYWKDIYKKIWPDFGCAVDILINGWAQRAGYDTIITLHSGTVIKIEKKIDHTPHENFFLEYLVDGKPGWIEKDLDCDFIAYAFQSRGECYMLPYQLLRLAWRMNREVWKEEHTMRPVNNGTFKAIGAAVPVDRVLKAMMGCCLIRI